MNRYQKRIALLEDTVLRCERSDVLVRSIAKTRKGIEIGVMERKSVKDFCVLPECRLKRAEMDVWSEVLSQTDSNSRMVVWIPLEMNSQGMVTMHSSSDLQNCLFGRSTFYPCVKTAELDKYFSAQLSCVKETGGLLYGYIPNVVALRNLQEDTWMEIGRAHV